MMAGLAIVGIVLAAAIVGYLISLHVAAIGAQADALDAKLKAGREDVRKLNTELDIRSRFVELQRWSPVLGLQPAKLGQYARSERQLDSVAAARRSEISLGNADHPALPCVAASARSSESCPPPPAVRGGDYTPQARKKLDSLIDNILK